MTLRWVVACALLCCALGSHSVIGAPADCSSYLTQAKKLNDDVQTLIGNALEQRLDVNGPSCKFRSDEWSVREEKHQAWCAGKDDTAVEQRLAKMSAELAACSGDLSTNRSTTSTTAPPPATPPPSPPSSSRSTPSTPPSTPPSSPQSGPRLVNFDQIAVGALSPDALRSAGIALVQSSGQPRVYAPEPNMVLPGGRSRVLLVAGDRTTSLTMIFDAPITRFALTRIGTANGASTPTWTLEAFNSAGAVVGSAGEEHGLPAEPQQFAVAGAGIVRVVLTTDNRWGEGTWATWNSLPVVELAFERGGLAARPPVPLGLPPPPAAAVARAAPAPAVSRLPAPPTGQGQSAIVMREIPAGLGPPPDFDVGLPPDPNTGIRVVAATWGANCLGAQPANDTQALADDCDGYTQSCQYLVDTTVFRDPAPSCAKIYTAQWTCGMDPTPHRADAVRRPDISPAPTDLLVTLDCGN